MGRWLEILAEDDGRSEGWVLHHREWELTRISNIDKGFQEAFRKVQNREVGLIPEGVEVGKYTSLMISLMRGSKTEVLNNELESSVIEANN